MRPRLLMPSADFCCLWFIFFFCFCHCCPKANGEFYSSVDSLKILGNMEAELVNTYRRNFSIQKENIETAQRFIKDVKLQHELAERDIADYIENPINAFTLIKRMVIDWKDIIQLLEFPKMETEEESLAELKAEMELVDENELQGAIKGLKRLQDIYKLSANDLANEENYGNVLDWDDCFEIGATLADDQDYHSAIDWLKLSFLKLRESEESNDIKFAYETQIREYLTIAYHDIGKYETAIEHLDDLIQNNPESNTKLTRNLLINYKNHENFNGDKIIDNEDNYARSCRGEKLKVSHQLSCKLDTKRHPFFILSPLQVEPLMLNPPITLYHNLINDEQIAKLLNSTHKHMERSKVVVRGKIMNYENRVSQRALVDSTKSNIAEMLYKFVGDITGLNMSNSQKMQVINYGIGGQYEPHWDYFEDGYETPYIGNRISTNMFYLSDVEEGGYTVFPNLDIYIKPIKGSMVIWYNLHKSLKMDERTWHAGCPVLKGSKSIANIWTYSGLQEFRRPCDLVDDSIY